MINNEPHIISTKKIFLPLVRPNIFNPLDIICNIKIAKNNPCIVPDPPAISAPPNITANILCNK